MNPKLILAISILLLLAATNGVTAWKFYGFGQDDIRTEWNTAEAARLKAEQDAADKIIKQKPKVKHDNQNRDRDALLRHVCSRGWVRDPDQCAPFR